MAKDDSSVILKAKRDPPDSLLEGAADRREKLDRVKKYYDELDVQIRQTFSDLPMVKFDRIESLGYWLVIDYPEELGELKADEGRLANLPIEIVPNQTYRTC